jgi:hypothetical protein
MRARFGNFQLTLVSGIEGCIRKESDLFPSTTQQAKQGKLMKQTVQYLSYPILLYHTHQCIYLEYILKHTFSSLSYTSPPPQPQPQSHASSHTPLPLFATLPSIPPVHHPPNIPHAQKPNKQEKKWIKAKTAPLTNALCYPSMHAFLLLDRSTSIPDSSLATI